MLPLFRKYVLQNSSAQTVAIATGVINLKETAWYVDPITGLIAYDTLPDDNLGFAADLLDGTELIGDTEISNVGNKYLGSQVQLEITHPLGDTAVGTFELYVAQGDATGELDTDATGYQDVTGTPPLYVGTLIWPITGPLDNEMIRSQVFSVGN